MWSIDPPRGEANALSVPPGKYGRKAKTQRNRRGLAQAVERLVQFDTERRTLPGLDILTIAFRKERILMQIGREDRCCMAVVSSCLEMFR
jgi:hypothetical protein